jgi:hypothetical protein
MIFQKGHTFSPGREEGSKNKKTLALLERWQDELDTIFEAMKGKDKTTEDYRTLVDAADKAQKHIQLLSGGATERVININFDSAFETSPITTNDSKEQSEV